MRRKIRGTVVQIVCEDLRCGGEDLFQRLRTALEVGHQELDAAAGQHRVDLSSGLGVQPGTAVGKVITGDAGDGRVAQFHLRHRGGHPGGLVLVVLGGTAGGDVAEVATARAQLATDEEGRLALVPALVDIGAVGLRAHGVELLPTHQVAYLPVGLRHHGTGLEPLGPAFDRCLGVPRLDTQKTTALRSDGAGHEPSSTYDDSAASLCQDASVWD